MNSFSESQALKLAMSCPEEFVNHNKKFLSRVYPNSMRVDSSNYNPQDLWNCGCQMGEAPGSREHVLLCLYFICELALLVRINFLTHDDGIQAP